MHVGYNSHHNSQHQCPAIGAPPRNDTKQGYCHLFEHLLGAIKFSACKRALLLCAQNRYIDSEEEEDGVDDEVFAQKMHQQLNSSRPRRAAAMQATAQMMVSTIAQPKGKGKANRKGHALSSAQWWGQQSMICRHRLQLCMFEHTVAHHCCRHSKLGPIIQS